MMPSSHCRHRQDKIVLYCLVGVRGVATSQDSRRLKISKQFCPVSKCGVNWVLSCPDPVSNSHATWLPIVTTYLETGSRLVHKRVPTAHETGQNWVSLQYIEDYWKLSATVANSVHTADVLSCRCRQCELGITVKLWLDSSRVNEFFSRLTGRG